MSTSATGYSSTPQVRFEVIGQAWELYRGQLAHWAINGLVMVLGGIAVSVAIDRVASVFRTSVWWTPPLIAFSVLNSTVGYMLVGMMLYVAIRHVWGDTPSLDRLSDVLPKMGKLFVASLVMVVINMIAFALCILPGLVTSGC